MSKQINKRKILRGKVIALVEKFIKTEGGITALDIQALFGPTLGGNEKISTHFANIPIKLS
jgi:hypothetical protein